MTEPTMRFQKMIPGMKLRRKLLMTCASYFPAYAWFLWAWSPAIQGGPPKDMRPGLNLHERHFFEREGKRFARI